MADLIVRYGVSRKAPRTRSKRKRGIQIKRGELRVPGGLYLDDRTWDAIKAKLRELHPGWSIMGVAYQSGPVDDHARRSNPSADWLAAERAEPKVRKAAAELGRALERVAKRGVYARIEPQDDFFVESEYDSTWSRGKRVTIAIGRPALKDDRRNLEVFLSFDGHGEWVAEVYDSPAPWTPAAMGRGGRGQTPLGSFTFKSLPPIVKRVSDLYQTLLSTGRLSNRRGNPGGWPEDPFYDKLHNWLYFGGDAWRWSGGRGDIPMGLGAADPMDLYQEWDRLSPGDLAARIKAVGAYIDAHPEPIIQGLQPPPWEAPEEVWDAWGQFKYWSNRSPEDYRYERAREEYQRKVRRRNPSHRGRRIGPPEPHSHQTYSYFDADTGARQVVPAGWKVYSMAWVGPGDDDYDVVETAVEEARADQEYHDSPYTARRAFGEWMRENPRHRNPDTDVVATLGDVWVERDRIDGSYSVRVYDGSYYLVASEWTREAPAIEEAQKWRSVPIRQRRAAIEAQVAG